jgi:hypothetical protein
VASDQFTIELDVFKDDFPPQGCDLEIVATDVEDIL